MGVVDDEKVSEAGPINGDDNRAAVAGVAGVAVGRGVMAPADADDEATDTAWAVTAVEARADVAVAVADAAAPEPVCVDCTADCGLHTSNGRTSRWTTTGT